MIKTNQRIEPEKGDAVTFVDFINKIVSMLVFQYGIKEIRYIKIDNWFDHKWLDYSGKAVVHFDFGGLKKFDDRNNSALENKWKEKITVPPFHPNRVIYEHYFRKVPIKNKIFEYHIHNEINSNDNIHNRIDRYTSNGLFVWFSSNTEINQKGSLMIYRVQEDEIQTWYATFENKESWQLTRTKGIGFHELRQYIE